MTPEELKYYTALQPKFQEAMGAARVGDSILYKNEPVTILMADGEGVYFRTSQSIGRVFINNASVILLPLPIDPVNSGRGLWGMVDWESQSFELYPMPDGKVSLILWEKDACDDNQDQHFHLSPTLALLKALAAQEGVEP